MPAITLDPENAALSIKRRLETIAACETYIREVTARYGGLNLFTAELDKLEIRQAVEALTAKGE